MEFRIGINSGNVIKDKDNLLGDGVNIASRLEALAQANGITISKVIYDYVNGKTKFDFNDLGVQKIKQNEFHAYDLFLSTRQERKVSGQVQNRYSIIIATIATIRAALTKTYFFILKNEKIDQNPERIIADKPSILIMPFENQIGQNENEYISLGITQNIISML